jgi:dihydroorotate dehydrogenase electron transfer subunit
MKESQAIIERIRRVNDDYQHLDLAVSDVLSQLKPGQSLLARPTERWDPYLREHWWPVALGPNRLTVERPAHLRYEPGQVVSVLGALGEPYRYRRTLRNVLLLAYDAPPTPLLMSIAWLLGNKISVTLVLLGSAIDYKTEHLAPEVEIIHGKNGKLDDHKTVLTWPNAVLTAGWADQIFVVVGQDDEMQRFGRIWALFSDLRADIPKNYIFGVFQPTQPCGVGACQACLLQTQQGLKPMCLEGPAYDLALVKFS